jgi:hypothetical protein
LRAFPDGYVAVLLPVHLANLGLEAFAFGAISAATLGSALLTLVFAYRLHRRPALLGGSRPGSRLRSAALTGGSTSARRSPFFTC